MLVDRARGRYDYTVIAQLINMNEKQHFLFGTLNTTYKKNPYHAILDNSYMHIIVMTCRTPFHNRIEKKIIVYIWAGFLINTDDLIASTQNGHLFEVDRHNSECEAPIFKVEMK